MVDDVLFVDFNGMRNVLAHEYGTVVPDKIYEVVTDHLPELLIRPAPLIESLEQDVGWQPGGAPDSSP